MKNYSLKAMKNAEHIQNNKKLLLSVLEDGYLTNDGIDKLLKDTLFRLYGLEYLDVSDVDFSKLTAEQLARISFASSTKFPGKNMLPKGFNKNQLLKNNLHCALNNFDFDDSKVCMTVIDNPTQFFKHDEFEDVDYQLIDLSKKTDQTHFHMEGVLCNVCGKNLGYAKRAKFLCYTIAWRTRAESYLKALQDIYNRIQNGQKIQAVSISNMLIEPKTEGTQLEKDILAMVKKLSGVDCEVIDSPRFFNAGFEPVMAPTTADVNDINSYNYAFNMPDRFGVKIAKLVPDFATKNGYKTDRVGGNSWAIPIVVYFYAVYKTKHPRASFEKFVSVCKGASFTNKIGVKIVDFSKVVKA